MKAPRTPTSEFEVSASDAKEALRNGEEQPIAAYLGALAEGLKLIADAFDPSSNQVPAQHIGSASQKTGERPSVEKDEDWDGTLSQFEDAVNLGSRPLIGELSPRSNHSAPPLGDSARSCSRF